MSHDEFARPDGDTPALPPAAQPPLPAAATFDAFAPLPQPEPRRGSTALRWVLVACIPVLLFGCVGAVVLAVEAGKKGAPRPGTEPTQVAEAAAPAPSIATSAPASPVGTGPRASTVAVSSAADLEKVCKGWYYPQSPPHAGPAPHPISILVPSVSTGGYIRSAFLGPDDASEAQRAAWTGENAPAVQLVACVDLLDTGGKVRDCKFDEPEPMTVPLHLSTYRLTLYEVATGRKLAEKQMPGEDDDCPFVALIGRERLLRTEIADRQYVSLLRPFVQR
ncbi:hypothetical protein Val02_64870 [Virgisporangium aliadipatigenens]|uniref:Uncharacterized protein n=1 Tax=Virgisporangium aliadipatigenens TaxID=741659 RepID=A0A8J4DTS4_9ACTN|nr:hypothetical protein [Virgisporangium aliadipatigenens]GIJ49601.1 hypothetical protein Val02_64870 [Virgisporangium aliadipatigenens]